MSVSSVRCCRLSHFMAVCTCTRMVSWRRIPWAVHNGWANMCLPSKRFKCVCEVFRVEATGKEDKENAKCAYDVGAVE